MFLLVHHRRALGGSVSIYLYLSTVYIDSPHFVDWTSAVGYTDNTAHNNIDFIPWFLSKMRDNEKARGKQLLNYLDIHYYFQADKSANDAAAKALRLRSTRSVWVRDCLSSHRLMAF
jgi:hypothetical protein